MRPLGVLVVALIMYVAVPMLWQYEVVGKVNELSKQPSGLPTNSAVPALDANMTIDVNAMNPAVTINTEEYERIAIQSQADQAMRQVQAAQDQAWQASHPNIP